MSKVAEGLRPDWYEDYPKIDIPSKRYDEEWVEHLLNCDFTIEQISKTTGYSVKTIMKHIKGE